MERAVLAARSLGALAAVPALAAGLGAWWLAGAFSATDPSWISGVLPGLLVLGVGLGAAFAPWDRPAGAWAWSAPLEGLAGGLAVAGLLAFPHSFLLLAPLLLAWAGAVTTCAAALVPAEETPEAQERRLRVRRLLRALGGACGVGLVLLWGPADADAHPFPLAAEIAPVISRPPEEQREGRVWREDVRLRVEGQGVSLTLRLDRPAIDGELQGQRFHLEPCLYVEQGSSDGFFPLRWLNGWSGEPRGLARCEWREGEHRAWISLEWPRGEAFGRRSLGTSTLGWGTHLEGAFSARLELEVDLEGQLLRVDAVTRLGRPVAVHKATLGWLRLQSPAAPRLSFGLEDGLATAPPARDEGAPGELLVRELDLVRALRARRGLRGPWEVLGQGSFEDWACLEQGGMRLAVVFPDWALQAACGPSPSAGHGLPMNGLHYWRQADQVNLLLDLGSSRVGPGPRATTLPAGQYRDRISLIPLGEGASARAWSLRERARLLGEAEAPDGG